MTSREVLVQSNVSNLVARLEDGMLTVVRFDDDVEDEFQFHFITSDDVKQACGYENLPKVESIEYVPNFDVRIHSTKELDDFIQKLKECDEFRIQCIKKLNEMFDLSINC